MGDAPEELPWGLDAKKLQKVGWRAGSLCSASSPPARASSVPSAMLRARISAASGVGARWPARRGLRLTGGCFGSLQGSKAQLTSDKIKGFQIGTQVGGCCVAPNLASYAERLLAAWGALRTRMMTRACALCRGRQSLSSRGTRRSKRPRSARRRRKR